MIDFLNELDAESESDEQPLLEAVSAAVFRTGRRDPGKQNRKTKVSSGKASNLPPIPTGPVRISYLKAIEQSERGARSLERRHKQGSRSRNL